MGRGGDTMLAHLRPDQAHFLARMGGAGTLNPNTGLPEYFNLGAIAKKAAQDIYDAGKGVVEGITSSSPNIGATASSYAKNFGTTVSTIPSSVTSSVASIPTNVYTAVTGVTNNFPDFGAEWEGFKANAQKEYERLKASLQENYTGFRKNLEETRDDITTKFYEERDAGIETLQHNVTGVRKNLEETRDDIVAKLNEERDAGLETLQHNYTGLRENMEETRDDITQKIQDEWDAGWETMQHNYTGLRKNMEGARDDFTQKLEDEKNRLLGILGLEPGDDNREKIDEIASAQLDAVKDRNEYWEDLRDSAKDLPAYQKYTGDKAALKEIASKNIVGPTPDELAGIEQYRKLDYEPDTSAMDDALETMKKIQGYTPGSLDVTQAMVNAKMNPYLDKAMERVAQQQAKANQMSGFAAAGSGAFGGSRQAIREAATAKEMGGVAGDLAYKNYMGMFERLQDQLKTQAQLGARGATGAYGMSKGIQDFRLARGRLKGADLLDIGKLQRDILQDRADELYRQQQAKFDASFAQKKSLNRFNMLEWARIQDDPYKILQAQTAVGAAEPIPTTTST